MKIYFHLIVKVNNVIIKLFFIKFSLNNFLVFARSVDPIELCDPVDPVVTRLPCSMVLIMWPS